ncbi:MAG: hypothetical protein WBP51_18140, partial [Candidatus Sulfotelmatobacter sp.]
DVGDDTTEGEASGRAQAKLPPRSGHQQWGEHDHGTADAVESAGVKMFRRGGLSRGGFDL